MWNCKSSVFSRPRPRASTSFRSLCVRLAYSESIGSVYWNRKRFRAAVAPHNRMKSCMSVSTCFLCTVPIPTACMPMPATRHKKSFDVQWNDYSSKHE